MAIWTLVKCGYFDGTHFCRKKFQTQYDWPKAKQEVKTYGWSFMKDGQPRCPDHRDTESIKKEVSDD